MLVAVRRTWRGQVLSSFVQPVLILLGMGVTVGGYVDRGVLLGKQLVTLDENAQDFRVAELDGAVVGCAAVPVL